MNHSRAIAAALVALAVAANICPAVSAHPPSSVSCTYDFAQQKLSMTISTEFSLKASTVP